MKNNYRCWNRGCAEKRATLAAQAAPVAPRGTGENLTDRVPEAVEARVAELGYRARLEYNGRGEFNGQEYPSTISFNFAQDRS